MSGGADWARIPLLVSNAITVPLVRRAVDGAVAGTLLIASWGPATALATAVRAPQGTG